MEKNVQVSLKFLLTELHVTQVDWPNCVLTKNLISASTCSPFDKTKNGHFVITQSALAMLVVNRKFVELGSYQTELKVFSWVANKEKDSALVSFIPNNSFF